MNETNLALHSIRTTVLNAVVNPTQNKQGTTLMGGRAEINKTTIQSRIDKEPESKWAALTVSMIDTAPT